MTDAEFENLIAQLLGDNPPRVWSLLVTIFGDLAIAESAQLSGACVNALTAALGIKPEATRVALHRLRKEGWITSERVGRQSRYALTKRGRAETLDAHPRIYASQGPNEWPKLVLENPNQSSGRQTKIDDTKTVRISPHTFITLRTTQPGNDWPFGIPTSQEIPNWAASKMCPTEIQDHSQSLEHHFSSISETCHSNTLSLIQKVALRAAVVHEWRRLVLKVPEFPDAMFPEGWRGAECRALFAQHLNALPAPILTDIEEYVSGRLPTDT